MLTPVPALKLPNYSKSYRIDLAADASDVAVGAELSQNRQPIAFYNKKLTPTKARYHVTDREIVGHISSLYEVQAIPTWAQVYNLH